MGRRAHRPDERGRRHVEALAAYGVPELDIARVVGVDPKTLRKHYRDELDLGSTKATAKVAEFLFRKATTEGPQCVTAAIFWMKTRGGQREAPQEHDIALKSIHELTNAELMAIAAGGIVPRLRTIDLKPTSDPDRQRGPAKVAEFLFRKATPRGPQCVTAAIFWMKTRGGRREAPQSHEVAIKPASEMTDAELEARIRELDTASVGLCWN